MQLRQSVGHPHTLSAVRPNTIVHVVHAFDLSARQTRDYFRSFESTRLSLSTPVVQEVGNRFPCTWDIFSSKPL